MSQSLAPSSHADTFTRDRLPPKDQWPVFVFDRPEVQYAEQLNCVQALLDEHVAQGRGDRMAVRGLDATGPMGWTYAQLQNKVNPSLHVCGHHHTRENWQSGITDVHVLGRDTMEDESVLIVDFERKEGSFSDFNEVREYAIVG